MSVYKVGDVLVYRNGYGTYSVIKVYEHSIVIANKEEEMTFSKEGVSLFFTLVKDIEIKVNCTCGAKHTSTPNYHLSYCDIK